MASSVFDFEKPEIIFTVVVLVIVFGVSFTQMRIGQAKTRDAQRKGDIELVSRAINAYLRDNNELPRATADGKIISCGRKALEECIWGESDIVDPSMSFISNIFLLTPQAYMGKKYVYTPDLINKNTKFMRLWKLIVETMYNVITMCKIIKGFTLIEFMVAMSLVAILSGIAMGNFMGTQKEVGMSVDNLT